MWKSKGKEEIMKNKKLRKWGKICAVSLALVMPLTDVLPYVTVATYAKENIPSGGESGNESGATGEDTAPSKEELKLSCGDSLNLKRNATQEVKATYGGGSPEGFKCEDTWTSSKEDVVIVERTASGEATIKALKVGNSEITVKLTSGEREIASKTVTVTVEKDETRVSLSIDPNNGTNINRIELTAGNLPSDATGDVQFYVDDSEYGNAVSVSNGSAEIAYESDILKGKHKFKAVYSGDDNYKSSEGEAQGTYKQRTSIDSLEVKDTGKRDQKILTVTASGLPNDATGTVTFYVYKKNELLSYKPVEVSGGSATYVYNEESKLIGDYSIEAFYSGDENYESCEKSNNEVGPYTQSRKIEFKESTTKSAPSVGTVDKDGKYSKKIEYSKSSVIEGEKSYTLQKQIDGDWKDVEGAKVDKDNFSTTKSGFYRVKVKVAATDYYLETESEDYFYIYVQDRIDLSTLSGVEGATLKLDDKVYDGTENVSGTYTVPLSEVKEKYNIWTQDKTEGDVVFDVKGTVDVRDVKVGTDGTATSYDNQKIKITSVTRLTVANATNYSEKYVEVEEKGVTPEATASLMIKKRPVYIGTENVTVTNTSDKTTKDLVEAQTGIAKDVSNKVTSEEKIKGFLDKEKETLRKGIQVTLDQDYYYESTCKEARVKPNLDVKVLGEKYNNYELKEASEELGSLTVTNMTVDATYIYKNVNFVSSEANQIYVKADEKKFWIGAGELSASAKDKDNNKYFDGVMFTDENKADKGVASYKVTYSNGSGERTVYVYLTKDGTVCSKPIQITYYVDVKDPEVAFVSTKGHSEDNDVKSGISKFLENITFGIYGNKDDNKADLKATVKDLPEKNASGINKCSYTVINTDEAEDVTAEDIKKSYEKGGIKFTEVGNFTEGEQFDIPIEAEEGTYVALVYAEDNVGNATIYASNGIMVEVEKPSINITTKDGESIKTETPYTDDVNYQVSIKDYDEETVKEDTIISGIKEYRVTVSYIDENGKKQILTDEEKTIADPKKFYEKAQLKDDLAKLYENKITQESNNITITVTATDQAGNVETISQNLMIDKTAPTVETSLSSEATAKNDYYYNKDVTMTVKVTEKNFLSDKDHLYFDVEKADGVEGNGIYEKLSLDELKKAGIIDGYEIKDSQKDLTNKTYNEGIKTYTNDRVNTITLYLNKDGEYTITPHCKDLGGLLNKESENDTKQHFVIDQKAPVITVEYSQVTPGSSEKGRAYSQEDVTAKITIDEVNFYTSDKTFVTSDEMEQMNFAETKSVALDGTVTSLEDEYKKAAENADWSSNGYVRISSPIAFTKEANYIYGFTYTDLAGNVAVYQPAYFTVDKTNPTGTVSIDERSWASFLEKITFGIFKNTKYNVSMTSEDATSGVEKTEYYKTDSEKTLDQIKAYKNWTNYSGVFSVSPNEQFIVYEKITDKSGRVTYVSSDGAIADDTKPTINITNKSTSRNGVFGGDVTLNIDVKDPENGKTYSGLEKVWYEVHSTGNVVNNKEEDLVDNSGNKVKGNQTWNGDIVIPASQFNSNDVKVQAHAIDFSGNQYDSEVVELKIDTTAPVATITFDNNSPLNGKYYNATRTATITVKERNFNPDEVSLNITNTHGTSAVVSGWTVDSSGTSDENVNTCTVAFTEDGDYTMNFSCVDLPGNQSNTVSIDEFTIDKTVPTISVAFDNNSANNGKYYNAPRTATITVVEHNFNGSEVQTAINASLQASGITAPGVNGWSSAGDSHTATVYFGTDGDYSFTVNYTDLAGNAATVATVDSFTIDQTKPEVEIFDIENKSANNGTVAPGVKYSDVNYNSNGVELTITGCEHDKKAIDGSRTSIANGQSIKMADFEHTEDMDDIYTMHAKVTDMAGNSTEKEVIFSVNRFGSTYYFSDDTKDFLDDYYHNEEEDLTVVEINVDEIEVNGISAGHDGELTDLKKGTDYKVKASGNEESWKQYTYTINKGNFEKEGQYNITINSTDKATNKVNNKIKNANIEFVIDKTAPSVVVNGIEDGKQYRSDSRDVDIAVSDNVAMGDMDIYVDDMDKAAKSYKSKEIVKENGKVTYTLGNSDNWQNIQVSVTDAAGNKAETELCKVLVTSNVIVQFYRNTMAVVITLVILVVIALIILLWAKRRRDSASEQ